METSGKFLSQDQPVEKNRKNSDAHLTISQEQVLPFDGEEYAPKDIVRVRKCHTHVTSPRREIPTLKEHGTGQELTSYHPPQPLDRQT